MIYNFCDTTPSSSFKATLVSTSPEPMRIRLYRGGSGANHKRVRYERIRKTIFRVAPTSVAGGTILELLALALRITGYRRVARR
jgi:hypothetical protein